jgi:hypothetical protein
MKRIIASVLVALLVVGIYVATKTPTPTPEVPRATHRDSPHRMHWAKKTRTGKLILNFDSTRLGSKWDPYTEYLIGKWEAAGTPFRLQIISPKPNYNLSLQTVVVASANYGATGWYGHTLLRYKDHLTVVYIFLNDYYPQNRNTKLHVYCQEIGHALGLEHNVDGPSGGSPDDSCMNNLSTNPLYLLPNSHDRQELGIIYNHSDGNGHAAGGAPPDTVTEITQDFYTPVPLSLLR